MGQRKYSSAVRYFNDCIPIFQELGHRSSLAEAMEHLGIALMRLGRRKDATRSLQRSKDLYRQLSTPASEARTGQLLRDAEATTYLSSARKRFLGR